MNNESQEEIPLANVSLQDNSFNIQNKQLQSLLTEENIGYYLDIASKIYYNPQTIKFKGVEFSPESHMFSDQEFDNLSHLYQQQYQEAKSQTIKSNVNRFQFPHPIVCGTLQKYTLPTIQNLITRLQKSNNQQFVITHKYDGVSCRVYLTHEYFGQYDIKILNRTDHNYGYDITQKIQPILQPYLSYLYQIMVNLNLTQLVLRGEIIKPETDRSEISGLISNQQTNIDIDLVLYELLMFQSQYTLIQLSYSQTLDFLNTIFDIYNPNRHVFIADYKLISINQLQDQTFKDFFNKKQQRNYYCDGIVIKEQYDYTNDYLRETPQFQLAYKFENHVYPTKITGYQWTVQQDHFQQKLIATVQYEPVVIHKTNYNQVEYKIDNNYREFKQARGFGPVWLLMNGLTIGSQISIQICGTVIPNIVVQYTETQAIDLFKQQYPSTEQRKQALMQFLPRQCFCGGRVSLDSVNHTTFLCKSGNCQYYNYIKKFMEIYKQYFQQTKNKYLDTQFQKIIQSKSPSHQFQQWFKDTVKEKRIQPTISNLLEIFYPGYGHIKAQQMNNDEGKQLLQQFFNEKLFLQLGIYLNLQK